MKGLLTCIITCIFLYEEFECFTFFRGDVVILGKIDNSYFHVCIGTLEERGNFVNYDLLRFWRNKKSVNKVI